MDAAVATEEVRKTFPNGAQVVDEGLEMTYPIVGLQVADVDGIAMLLGWALPNKDFYFDLSSAQVRDDGWLVNRNGARCLLKPLDPAEAKKVQTTMELMS